MNKPNYTLLLHSCRKSLGISFLEYAVVEGIAHLSGQPQFPWCVTSKQHLAEFFDMTRFGLQKIIKRMEERGLLERNEKDQLRATQKWYDAVENYNDEGPANKSNNLMNFEEKVGTPANKVGTQENPNPDQACQQSWHNHIYQNNNQNNNISKETEDNTKPSTNSDGKKEYTDTEVQKIADQVVEVFNTALGRNYRSARSVAANLKVWLTEYAPEEIYQAIRNAVYSDFWKTHLTPDLLLRQRRPTVPGEAHEHVDRIGDLLNITKPDDPKIEEVTYENVWNLAKKLDIPIQYVKIKVKRMMEMVQNGSFHPKEPGTTFMMALERWLQLDLAKGYTNHCNEIERIDLEESSPEKMKQRKADRQRAYQILKERGYYDK